jgi:hypothetical protein
VLGPIIPDHLHYHFTSAFFYYQYITSVRNWDPIQAASAVLIFYINLPLHSDPVYNVYGISADLQHFTCRTH